MSDLIPAVTVETDTRGVFPTPQKIHARRIKGFFQRLRRLINGPLMALFFLTPWFSIDGRPAVYLDLAEQKFHIFWLTLWPQDGILLTWVLILAAFMLFVATVWVGRAWCGFSCPQTIWTAMFMWVEDKCEGDRNQRIKLDKQAYGWQGKGLEKLLRRGGSRSLWGLISLATGLTFISYFYGVQALVVDLATLEAPLQAYFWVLLFAGFTYVNAGVLREQFCQFMCPYSRIQSVMYDKDTLVVTYDAARGETRGARKPKDDYKASGLGDCTDCSWCVQVCPVGIDIRNGLQAECIDCGLCIDACDQVMDKMGYQRGLIRFATETSLATGHYQIFRPRFLGYVATLLVAVGLFIGGLADRNPVSVDVTRDRGTQLYRVNSHGIENVYTVKINNRGQGQQSYRLSVDDELPYEIKAPKNITLAEGERYTVPVRIRLPKSELLTSVDHLNIVVHSLENPDVTDRQETSFIGPVMDQESAKTAKQRI